MAQLVPFPLPMILHCPACGLQHVDAPEAQSMPDFDPRYVVPVGPAWTNPPHKSHLCAGCGHVWRPCDVPTTGVQAISTKGKDDSPPVAPYRGAPRVTATQRRARPEVPF